MLLKPNYSYVWSYPCRYRVLVTSDWFGLRIAVIAKLGQISLVWDRCFQVPTKRCNGVHLLTRHVGNISWRSQSLRWQHTRDRIGCEHRRNSCLVGSHEKRNEVLSHALSRVSNNFRPHTRSQEQIRTFQVHDSTDSKAQLAFSDATSRLSNTLILQVCKALSG